MSLQSTPTVPDDHILAVYNRAPLAFDRGVGARLYTAEGEAYLDCLAGIAAAHRLQLPQKFAPTASLRQVEFMSCRTHLACPA
jgi:acetylornithine/succinyldiaminopimelate/putrescine aminotransferase